MKQPGQIVLFPFPQIDFSVGKMRPALLLAKLPGAHHDWLLCMISSQQQHFVEGFDELLRPSDGDFIRSGLKTASVIRVGRLAVAEGRTLLGSIGEISEERLQAITQRLARWIAQD